MSSPKDVPNYQNPLLTSIRCQAHWMCSVHRRIYTQTYVKHIGFELSSHDHAYSWVCMYFCCLLNHMVRVWENSTFKYPARGWSLAHSDPPAPTTAKLSQPLRNADSWMECAQQAITRSSVSVKPSSLAVAKNCVWMSCENIPGSLPHCIWIANHQLC